MVSRVSLVTCIVLCCLAVMAAAGPTRHEHLRGRQRSAALKSSRPAVATSIATARAQQEESDEPEEEEVARTEQPQEAEEPQHDDEQEDEEEIVTPAPVKPRKPAHRPRAQRPQRPQRPATTTTTTTTAAPESEEEDHEGGVTAVASSVSHGAGAISHSRAAAYGGRYTNGRFGRRN